MPEETDLSRELAKYAEIEQSLLEQGLAGKWVVIAGDRQLGVFDDPEDAHAKGVEETGLDGTFLLKQVGRDDNATLPAFHLGLLARVGS